MNKNPAWLTLLAFSFLVTGWFFVPTAFKLYNYSTLTKTTKASNLNWFIEELSSEKFQIGAAYTFKVLEKDYSGTTLFNESFRNPLTADDQLKIEEKKDHLVFYNPSNLHHSSLQKKFPTKECASTAILLLISLYFVGIGFYKEKLEK